MIYKGCEPEVKEIFKSQLGCDLRNSLNCNDVHGLGDSFPYGNKAPVGITPPVPYGTSVGIGVGGILDSSSQSDTRGIEGRCKSCQHFETGTGLLGSLGSPVKGHVTDLLTTAAHDGPNLTCRLIHYGDGGLGLGNIVLCLSPCGNGIALVHNMLLKCLYISLCLLLILINGSVSGVGFLKVFDHVILTEVLVGTVRSFDSEPIGKIIIYPLGIVLIIVGFFITYLLDLHVLSGIYLETAAVDSVISLGI